jgi:hypothetical protein
LLNAKLPELCGHGALTPTSVLRQLIRYVVAPTDEERTVTANAIKRSLKHTLSGDADGKLYHHFLFLTDFWLRTGAIALTDDPTWPGIRPTAMASFGSHLHFLPDILCFTDAMCRGAERSYFMDVAHELYKEGDKLDDTTMESQYEEKDLRKMLGIVSMFLCRRTLPANTNTKAARESTHGQCIVELDLDEAALATMGEFNELTLKSFSGYANRFNHLVGDAEATDGVSNHLPGSVRPELVPLVGGGAAAAPGAAARKAVMDQMLLTTSTRSSFLTMCGRSDTFDSLGDLLQSTNDGVGFERCAVPTTVLPTDRLSAYLVDFFRGCTKEDMARVHGLKEATQYDTFYTFNHALRVVHRALQRYAEDGDHPIGDPLYKLAVVFERLADKFNAKFKERFSRRN